MAADGELNRELRHFLLDPPSNPSLLRGKTVAIGCTNGVEEGEITGAIRWLTEHGATVHVVAPRIGDFHPTLGLRFPYDLPRMIQALVRQLVGGPLGVVS